MYSDSAVILIFNIRIGALIGKGVLINKTLVRVWEIWGEGRSLKEAVSEGATALVPLIFYKFLKEKVHWHFDLSFSREGSKKYYAFFAGAKIQTSSIGENGERFVGELTKTSVWPSAGRDFESRNL